MNATCNRVNKALEKAGFADVELVQGKGYCYFWPIGPFNTDHWIDHYTSWGYTTSVMLPRVSDLTVDQWVLELRDMFSTWQDVK